MEMKRKLGTRTHIRQKRLFKTNTVSRDKEGHYITILGSIQQEDITIINIYAPNIGAPKYIKQILTNIKEETERNSNSRGH